MKISSDPLRPAAGGKPGHPILPRSSPHPSGKAHKPGPRPNGSSGTAAQPAPDASHRNTPRVTQPLLNAKVAGSLRTAPSAALSMPATAPSCPVTNAKTTTTVVSRQELHPACPPLAVQARPSAAANRQCAADDPVVGLHGAKAALLEACLLPALLPPFLLQGVRAVPSAVLLYGPPGTGKTMLARLIAERCGRAFLSLSPSGVLSKWSGDAEKALRAAFEQAVAQVREHVATGSAGASDVSWLSLDTFP